MVPHRRFYFSVGFAYATTEARSYVRTYNVRQRKPAIFRHGVDTRLQGIYTLSLYYLCIYPLNSCHRRQREPLASVNDCPLPASCMCALNSADRWHIINFSQVWSLWYPCHPRRITQVSSADIVGWEWQILARLSWSACKSSSPCIAQDRNKP